MDATTPAHAHRTPPARLAALALGLGTLSALAGWLAAGPLGLALAVAGFAIVALAAGRPATAAPSPRRPRPVPLGEPPTPLAATFARILTGLEHGFATLEPDGRVQMANTVLESMFAPGGKPLLGQKLTELVMPSDAPHLERTLSLVAQGSAVVRDARVRPAAAQRQPIFLTVGRAPGLAMLFVVARSDRHSAELEAQAAQATRMQALGQLAGGVAHDFNNILTAIIATCDLALSRHAPGTPDHQDIDQVRQSAHRAADLVRQLLAFSRQQTLKTRIVHIPDLVGELSHLLRRLLGETVRLRIVHGRDLPPVRADPGQLEQVLVNLAVNARDAMAGGGELTIATYAVPAADVPALGHPMMPPADYVAIAVRDTGHGIPPDVLPSIFDPFFTTKAPGQGTGLGLATVYGIVKQTGGFIFADSTVGVGTTISIYLPAALGEQAESLRQLRTAEPAAWGSGTILLVEDEAMVRAVTARALTRSGYKVLVASDGEAALRLLDERQGKVDLLISDVVMPGMDGPTLVQKARARFPELRVLFISGYAEEQLRGRVDDASRTLLRKPYSIHELGAAVRERLAA
jgi:two-component system cell cycle sensor histidine kinase/response regulator CckA